MACLQHTIEDEARRLCEKIREIYPDIGRCGIDVQASYDEQTKAWVVSLSKEGHTLKTFLEPQDVQACKEGRECIHLGLQIEQLKKHVGLL
ncbi:MAG: hypothetical protein N2260_09975 [Syntrophobacterales bacterium]|nr:hypothetical protein [Syntrophobacterales bacterium]